MDRNSASHGTKNAMDFVCAKFLSIKRTGKVSYP